MGIKSKLEAELKKALKAKDGPRLSASREILGVIKYAELNKEEGQDQALSEAEEVSILSKLKKRHLESIDAFEKGNRPDLVSKEKTELDILAPYLPPQLSRDEIIDFARKAIAEVGAKSPGDKGKVMGKLMAQTKGKADGKAVNDIVTELLGNL